MMEIDRADLRHTMREERIADGRGEHYGGEDEVLFEGKAVSHLLRFYRAELLGLSRKLGHSIGTFLGPPLPHTGVLSSIIATVTF